MPAKKRTAAASKKVERPAKPVEQVVQRPQWPRLQPLPLPQDLSLDVLLADQIILIHKLFSSNLCQQYIKFLSTLPLTTTPGKPKKDEALRVSGRYQVHDPDFANQLWSTTALKGLIESHEQDWGGEVVGLNPNIRILRYSEGQFFNQHYDESNIITIPTTPPTPARTTWTLLIYLTGPNTGCIGGETAFYPEHGQVKSFSAKKRVDAAPIVVAPEVGLALLHKHGDDCLLHEGREVLGGDKWIIRSDLCVKR